MATSEAISGYVERGGIWDLLRAGRPMLALAAALLTTTGHPMNLRELGVAQGWVAAELYTLQSCYLAGLALMLLTCPALEQRFSCRGLAEGGLALLAVGSFANGLWIWAPLPTFLAGRVVAGAGAGLTIYFVPRLLEPRWLSAASLAAILLPVAGPAVISSASMIRGVSDWEWGFLFEGGMAAAALVLLLSMTRTSFFHSQSLAREPGERARATPSRSLAYLPSLVVAVAALFYCLHWGQLQGWLESYDIVLASFLGSAALAVTLWLVWPQLDFLTLRENGLRLGLFFFGGFVQFFHGYTMNVYGGSLINFSSWQRAWLIWPMPLGVAVGLTFAQLYGYGRRRPSPALPGAAVGLLVLAGGLYLCLRETLEWPFWQIRDTVDLNWFAAPEHWQLASGRFLMGLGVALFMMAMDTLLAADLERETKVRPFLLVVQFFGGAVAAGVLINFLLIGHPVHYSYAADRDYIQADEMTQRRAVLSDALRAAGDPAPDRAAEVLMYRGVNYEADNLVFASIYAAFFVAALFLAGLTLSLWTWHRLRAPPDVPVVERERAERSE
jgi:MFS family permease